MSENAFLQWMSKETPSIYWHDSAVIDELDDAMHNGAVGVTTNPFLVNGTLRAAPDFWADKIQDIPPSLTGDAKVEALMRSVTGFIAEKLRPLYDANGKEYGRCCAQVSPNKPGDAKGMLVQAERFLKWAPNLCIKLPATRAGLIVCEELAARGCNVVMTVSFTVPQALAIGQTFQRGFERARKAGITPGLGVAVIMVGRLDDYLRDVAQDSGASVSESDIVQAGTAAIKRAYKIFRERGYEAVLMPAGCRGTYHITELAGANMIMSIAPKIAALLSKLEGPFEQRIDVPVAEDVIERLMTLPEFRKAYQPDGMTQEEFITFGSCNRTLTQFIESGWGQLEAFRL